MTKTKGKVCPETGMPCYYGSCRHVKDKCVMKNPNMVRISKRVNTLLPSPLRGKGKKK